MSKRKTITSYYDYPLRSFLRSKRAYVLLACSILCMVILCASVLIYYASSYEADIEMLRRENGPQHTQFYDLDPAVVSDYVRGDYIRDYTKKYSPWQSSLSSQSGAFSAILSMICWGSPWCSGKVQKWQGTQILLPSFPAYSAAWKPSRLP